MKPEQFIRDFGEKRAREVVEYKGSNCGIAQSYSPLTSKYYSLLDGVFYFFSESTSQFLKYADEVSSTLDLVDLSDLKRLVESLDLVNFHNGLKQARHYLTQGYCLSEKHTWNDLAQAIRDHESIYGGGDE
ncbi:hypothetical protein [Acinetobacter baumannii]|uniref:hypothetical protein n=1 Tax=Acinetobacter baumannii TaxID=470 RepID=UPI0022B3B2C0|nr:hypothetical protein [Acinetobacter baumannii]